MVPASSETNSHPDPVAAARAAETLRADFVEALGHHRAGRLAAAEAAYRRVLAVDAQHADALHLLGLVAQASGRAPLALSLIARAIECRPGQAEMYVNLGTTLRTLGLVPQALASLRKALELDPAHRNAHIQVGALLLENGRHEEALRAMEAALVHHPELVAAHNNRAVGLRALGRLGEAAAALRRAVALQPDDPQALNNLSVILLELGQAEQALPLSRRAVELAPGDAAARTQLAAVLKEAGQSDAALLTYEQAANLAPPGDASPLVGRATLLMELGRGAEAAQAAAQALAMDPGSGPAWHVRSELKQFGRNDPDLAAMQAALARAAARGAADSGRIDLEFALGKAWLDAGDPPQAFAHFDAANRRRRAGLRYDPQAVSRCFQEVAELFSPALFERLGGAGDRSERPIFVIGMPRSGTTLVEQILASHPLVHGAGELSAIGDVLSAHLAREAGRQGYPGALSTLTPATLARLGADYLARTAARGPAGRRLVDKMPMNFQYAGLIHLMLPNARIVHCRRDAADTCLSCYTRNLRGRLAFCCDQRELGALYRDYSRLMAHWRTVLPPQRFLEVDYEAVVEDLEGEARRLLAFCGLPWDPACLSFHQTRRAVQTASVNQVRRPIYRASVGRWRGYAPWLRPLLEELGLAEDAAPAQPS